MMKKLTAIVGGVVTLRLCFAETNADGAKDKSKLAAAIDVIHPAAVSSQTGAWSKEVNGVQGRLIVSQDPILNEAQMISVYLELRNVSDVLNPLGIYYTGVNRNGMVINKGGKEVPTAGLPASILRRGCVV